MHTRKQDEIDNLIHTTLMSFFKFWKNIQGLPKLYEHMLTLGFGIKSDGNIQAGETVKKVKSTGKIKETSKKIREELECV